MTYNKYKVAPVQDRTDEHGTVYHSKAEMRYAAQLALDPTVEWFLRQVPVRLTADDKTVVDFLVCGRIEVYDDDSGRIAGYGAHIQAHEVKGAETREFKRIKRLWVKYAPFPMRVIRNGKTVEVIEPQA